MTRSGLGNMPLTLWLLVAGVVTYLYIRRSNLGIDTHPGEGKPVPVRPAPPTVVIPGPMSPGASAPGPPLSPFEAWLNNLLHHVPVPAPPGTIPVTGTGKGV